MLGRLADPLGDHPREVDLDQLHAEQRGDHLGGHRLARAGVAGEQRLEAALGADNGLVPSASLSQRQAAGEGGELDDLLVQRGRQDKVARRPPRVGHRDKPVGTGRGNRGAAAVSSPRTPPCRPAQRGGSTGQPGRGRHGRRAQPEPGGQVGRLVLGQLGVPGPPCAGLLWRTCLAGPGLDPAAAGEDPDRPPGRWPR